MAYNSKYTGQEVEELLDKVNEGGAGGGISEIETEATSPLHLEATISGTLATITGSVDRADANNYGVVCCKYVAHSSTTWDPPCNEDPYSYKVYRTERSKSDDYEGLYVTLPYPDPQHVQVYYSLDSMKYILGVTLNGEVGIVPVDYFTQG